jgi:hypothetical protein
MGIFDSRVAKGVKEEFDMKCRKLKVLLLGKYTGRSLAIFKQLKGALSAKGFKNTRLVMDFPDRRVDIDIHYKGNKNAYNADKSKFYDIQADARIFMFIKDADPPAYITVAEFEQSVDRRLKDTAVMYEEDAKLVPLYSEYTEVFDGSMCDFEDVEGLVEAAIGFLTTVVQRLPTRDLISREPPVWRSSEISPDIVRKARRSQEFE